MWYLQVTPNLPLVLCGDSTGTIKWWANGSHGTHSDCKGHSGGCMTLGSSMAISSLIKQKLNTRSSIKTELVTTNDFMPILLWTNNFFRVQDFQISKMVLHQDNQSAILFQKNGKLSSLKCTKHINMCYFFITDHIMKGNLSIKYCLMESMAADFFTKLLQGSMFLEFCCAILNHPTW